MTNKPIPDKYVLDEKDVPPGKGWNMWHILWKLNNRIVPKSFQGFFNRDPERKTPPGPVIVAPADGLLELRRRPGKIPEFIIHLRLTDVHVQRVPFPGVVSSVAEEGQGHYYPGQEGYLYGVQTVTTIDSALGRYSVRQITSFLTTRIKNFLKPGQKVAAGQRLGRILLGSTVILEMPGNWRVEAREGQKVFGGETVLARLP